MTQRIILLFSNQYLTKRLADINSSIYIQIIQ